jgi:predicted AAA+ superfamily ATPase
MSIKFEKSWIGTRSVTINDKVRFFIGTSDRWGLDISYSHYDRCLSLMVIHWYMGVEVWHNE